MNHLKLILFSLFLCVSILPMKAQLGYTQYLKKDNVVFSYKWGTTTDKKERTKQPALLMMVKNENDFDVDFSYSLDFYYEGILRESSDAAQYCIRANKMRVGKINGIIYPINKFTQEQIENKDFNFEINDVVVDKSSGCVD